MSDIASVQTNDGQERFAPRHGDPVTPWRLELASLQHSMSAHILAHADPEEALRVAHDVAADVAHEVKQSLLREHGRTFDALFDGQQTTAEEVGPRPQGTLRERVLRAVTEQPGITQKEMSAFVFGRQNGASAISVGQVAPVVTELMAAGKISRRGEGIRGNPYTYRPK